MTYHKNITLFRLFQILDKANFRHKIPHKYTFVDYYFWCSKKEIIFRVYEDSTMKLIINTKVGVRICEVRSKLQYPDLKLYFQVLVK